MADKALQTFQLDRVLDQDAPSFLCVLGSATLGGTTDKHPCILRFEKTAFSGDSARTLSTAKAFQQLKTVVTNDSYATLLGWLQPQTDAADIKISVICPATDKHVRKYSAQDSYFVRETPRLHQQVVKPYIESLPLSQIQWVYNILEGTAEAENVIHRDPEYLLTPDLKWDQKTIESLYLVVLVQDRALRSLRDLRQVHLPLLRKIRRDVEKVALERYGSSGLARDSLRFFVHYQPTYYHFHVHVAHVKFVGTSGVTVGQAHLLDDIMDNVELDDEYYSKRTLTYALGERHALYELLQKAGASPSQSSEGQS